VQYSDRYVFTAGQRSPIRHRNFARRHFDPAVAKARKVDETIPEDLRFHDPRGIVARASSLRTVATWRR
jgi:hypothetical protein